MSGVSQSTSWVPRSSRQHNVLPGGKRLMPVKGVRLASTVIAACDRTKSLSSSRGVGAPDTSAPGFVATSSCSSGTSRWV